MGKLNFFLFKVAAPPKTVKKGIGMPSPRKMLGIKKKNRQSDLGDLIDAL